VAGALAVLHEVAVVALLVPDGAVVATETKDLAVVGAADFALVGGAVVFETGAGATTGDGAVFETGAGATTGDGAGPGCSTTDPAYVALVGPDDRATPAAAATGKDPAVGPVYTRAAEGPGYNFVDGKYMPLVGATAAVATEEARGSGTRLKLRSRFVVTLICFIRPKSTS